MFGEKELKGIKQLKLTNRNISLPEFTHAEPNEWLYFLKLGNEIRLYNEEKIIKLTNILIDNYAKNHTSNELRHFKRILYALSIATNKVSASKTLKIPQDIIEQQNFQKDVVVVGANTHLKIFKNMNTYKKYLESKKV